MNTAAVQKAIDDLYALLERERFRYYLGNSDEQSTSLYDLAWSLVYEFKNMFAYVTTMTYNNVINAVWQEPEPVPFLRKLYQEMFDKYGIDREMCPEELRKLFKFLYIQRGNTDWEDQLPELARHVETALGGRQNIATLIELRRQQRLTQEAFDSVVYPNRSIPVRIANGEVILLAPDELPRSLIGKQLSYKDPNELNPEDASAIAEEIAIQINEHKYSDDEQDDDEEESEEEKAVDDLVMVVPQRDRSVKLVFQEHKGSSQYAPTMFAGSMSTPPTQQKNPQVETSVAYK
jgi:hypothetical protein